MGECDDGGCLVVDFGDFEHQLLQTRISVVTLPTPSMVRCGGNSNAHWVVLFVEAYGGGEVLRKVKSRVFGSTGSLPSKNVGFWSDLLLKVEKILIIEVKIRCKSVVDVHGNIVLVCVVDA